MPDLRRALGRLLEVLGYSLFQNWEGGRGWRFGPTYPAIEQSSALTAKITTASAQPGWQLMSPERHPYAGGGQYCAAHLENDDGFETELVSINAPERK
ncbi:glyoxalase [Streptomyces sp. BBFR51]|uniref:glyoxalase n=1 Tax=Streptomyces sp. BBFR51 TaxID=3372856 RepID=UPI0037DD3BC5